MPIAPNAVADLVAEPQPTAPALPPRPAVATPAVSPIVSPISSPILARLLSRAALQATAPTAPGVPEALWRDVLVAPVLELLGRPGKNFRGRLTEMAFRLAGGSGDPPLALATMLEIVHAGSMIVDDIEDGSSERRGGPTVHRLHGLPLALNAGNWMYFAPFELIAALDLPVAAELRVRRRMSRVLLDCHYGQALDLGARPDELPAPDLAAVVRAISLLKTGRLLGLAAEAGAIVAGADEALGGDIREFGEALGVGLQMLDDLGNLSGRAAPDKRYEDLRTGRLTWVWAWAAEQLPESVFLDLLRERAGLAAERNASGSRRSRTHGWQALAAELRGLIGPHGRSTAHRHLTEALARLRAAVGAHPVLDAVAAEIARLEASYG